MCELIILIFLSIPVVLFTILFFKEGFYLLGFMLCIFISFSVLYSMILVNHRKQKNNNDINTRYEELTAETIEKSATEKSDIKTIRKNNKSDIVMTTNYELGIIKVNGINSLILKAKDFNDLKHIFTCNKCLKKLQQDYVNAYNIKNLEIYWDKGNYKFNSNTVIQLSSISIN